MGKYRISFDNTHFSCIHLFMHYFYPNQITSYQMSGTLIRLEDIK